MELQKVSPINKAIYVFADLFKIRQSIMLILVGIISYFIASRGDVVLDKLFLLFLGLTLSVFGTTGFNMVLDRDIDSLMFRTSKRSIPSGLISSEKASIISAAILLAGLYFSYLVNIYVFIAAFLGFLIDILIYTILTKRRTWSSVIFGGFAGGMPAFGGYLAYTNAISVEPFILLLMVAIWSNVHIWYIVIYYKDDYLRAGIPMLPVVKGDRTAILVSIIHMVLLQILIALYFYISGFKAILTFTLGSMLTWIIMYKMYRHYIYIDRYEAYRMFKFLSPYLAVVFIFMLLDSVIFM